MGEDVSTPLGGPIQIGGLWSVQPQAERPGEEDRHLLARDRGGGAEQRWAGAAAAHHAAVGELLDPWAEGARLGNVVEPVRRHAGRRDQYRIERAQHEDRHLLARDGAARTVGGPRSASACDAPPEQLLYEAAERAAGRHVGEDRRAAGRRQVARALLRDQDELRHLLAGGGVSGAVVRAAA